MSVSRLLVLLFLEGLLTKEETTLLRRFLENNALDLLSYLSPFQPYWYIAYFLPVFFVFVWAVSSLQPWVICCLTFIFILFSLLATYLLYCHHIRKLQAKLQADSVISDTPCKHTKLYEKIVAALPKPVFLIDPDKPAEIVINGVRDYEDIRFLASVYKRERGNISTFRT